ncbi:MAG: hypothetical protein WAN43_01265 [Rhodomicrobium sp.]
MTAHLTVIRNAHGPLSKTFTLKDGTLQKTATADLVEGHATRVAIDDIHGLANVLAGLDASEALTFGVTRNRVARIATQAAVKRGRALGAICRDREHFRWPNGRGVLMLDIDRPKDGSAPFTPKSFDDLMRGLFPWWHGCARLYRASASAFIYDANGVELSGAGSLRGYAVADRAENIPHLGVAIVDAFWRAGFGRIEFSASGSMLVRCPVDDAVWQPERLDFAGPAVLGEGLRQSPRAPIVVDGADIDTEAVIAGGPGKITLSTWRAGSLHVCRAKQAARPTEKARRKSYIAERVKQEKQRGGNAAAARRKWTAAVADKSLSGDFALHFQFQGFATVDEVLSDPERFDFERLADPSEPTYANDPRIAQFYWNGGRPHIYSHAHGGCKYVLAAEGGGDA